MNKKQWNEFNMITRRCSLITRIKLASLIKKIENGMKKDFSGGAEWF